MEIKKTLIAQSELKKDFSIIIPLSAIQTEIENEVKDRQKTYKIDGFRVGKVPVEVIKQRESVALFFNSAENLINRIVYDIANENKFKLSIQPKVDIKVMEENKDAEFTVSYELLPEIPEFDLKSIKLDQHIISIEDNDINDAINKIQENFKKYTKKDGAAKLNDAVKINFLGKINGEPFDGGKAEDYQLVLGSHSFIDTFEDQLIGKMANDNVLVNVTFPENYQKSDLAGKPATFEVKILEVLVAENEDLSDEMVKKNFSVDTVDKFKEIVKNELEKTYKTLSKNKIKEKLFDEIASIVDFNLPDSIVEEQFKKNLEIKKQENLKADKKEKINEEELMNDAKKSIKIGLILSKIGQDVKISLSENEITQAIMQNAMSMPGYEKMFIDFYKNNKDALEGLKGQLLEEKVMDYIIDNITKNEIITTIKEFEKLVK